MIAIKQARLKCSWARKFFEEIGLYYPLQHLPLRSLQPLLNHEIIAAHLQVFQVFVSAMTPGGAVATPSLYAAQVSWMDTTAA